MYREHTKEVRIGNRVIGGVAYGKINGKDNSDGTGQKMWKQQWHRFWS